MLKAQACGRVVNDAKVFVYQNGKGSGVNFDLACDRGFGDNKTTSFIRCTIFGRDEKTAQYITQGNQMIVSGDLDINYDRESGATYISILVQDFEFGAKKQ